MVGQISETLEEGRITKSASLVSDSVLALEGFVAGIEIGGQGERVVLADLQGRITDEITHSLEPETEAATIVKKIKSMLSDLVRRNQIDCGKIVRIGVGFGGPVDADQGVTLLSHRRPGWRGFPLKESIEEELNIPTLVDNDANMAALGETWFGAAQGRRNIVYLHLGSGVGAGLVLDGRLYHGATSTAGEVGHIVVERDGPLCSCGKRGHLEAFVSGPAIVKAAREAPQGEESVLSRLAQSEDGNLTPNLVFRAASLGDPLCSRIVEGVVSRLAIALAHIVDIVNPDLIVVGGSVAAAGDSLFDPLNRLVEELALPVAKQGVRIIPAKLGRDAVIVGAVALALHSLHA
ncbi:MAG: ROK family protein [Chloroflexi bacterium]|nr:ROK family protein [Chloroflexota bacterium]